MPNDVPSVKAFWDAVATNLLDYEWYAHHGPTPLHFSVVYSSMVTYTRDGRTYVFPRDGDLLVGFKLDDDGLGDEPVTMDLSGHRYSLTLRPHRIVLALHGRSAIPTGVYAFGTTVMTMLRPRKFEAIYATSAWSKKAMDLGPHYRAILHTMYSRALVFPFDDTQSVQFVASMCGVALSKNIDPRYVIPLPDLTAAVDRCEAEQQRTRQRILAIEHDLMRAAWHPSRMGNCLDVGEAAAFEVRAPARRLHDVAWVADGTCMIDAMFDDAECERLQASLVRARLDAFVRWVRPCGFANGREDHVLRVFLRDQPVESGSVVRPKRGRAVIMPMAAHNATANANDWVSFRLRSARFARAVAS